jgi:glycosyltransferase involved in cell wall biosynthesis
VHDAIHAYRSVRVWIAPSRFVADKVAEHGLPAARVRVVPHGMELGAWAGSAGAGAVTAGAGAAAPRYVLFAGRLSAEKGVRLLPGLAMRHAPTPLRVAGDGPLRGWLDTQRAALPNLELLGHREGPEFAQLLRGAAVVVVPSLFYETFCFAAGEALAAARPVVASEIGAIPELIEHERTGLLARPDDVHSLAEATSRALADASARDWGEAGRARVLEHCDPARHLDGLLGVYREAMAG